MDSAPIAAGSYTFPSSSSKTVTISYALGVDPNGTMSNYYVLSSSATAVISAYSSSSAQGTFSGNGMYFASGTPNPAQTITVTGGSFTVPVTAGGGGAVMQTNSKIESIVKRIANSNKR
jgi:hypothetical protein